MSGRLEGKVALVTGGARRAGRCLALALAAAGADVVVSHRGHEAQAAALAGEVTAMGRRCLAVTADMRRVPDMPRLVDTIEAAFGRLDIVVHNAGNFNRQPFCEVSEEAFDSSLETMVKGPLFLSQAAAPLMLRHGGGKFIAIAGGSYHENMPEYIVHGIAKTGLVKLIQGLALAYSPHIQGYAICPDNILPEKAPGLVPDRRDEDIATSRGSIVEKKGVLLRNGNCEDLAELLLYLCSATPYLNGNVIDLDGGRWLF